MYKGNTILAVICARGGSKGVKNKNIREINGKPLIYYSLKLLKESNYIDDYIISTDSNNIIKIIEEYDFKAEFKRPNYLALDKVSRIQVIKHAVKWMARKEKIYNIIVDIGVATPLKTVYDMDKCIELLVDTRASNILTVTPSARNPYYNMVEVINDKVRKVKDIGLLKDRRDAPSVYDMNDGFNVWQYEVLFSDSSQFNNKTKLYVMPRERSVDIDEEIDFIIAETLMKEGRNEI